MYVFHIELGSRKGGREIMTANHVPPHRYVTESPRAADARAEEAAEVDALGTAPDAEEEFIYTI
jgi:hypothetical protein